MSNDCDAGTETLRSAGNRIGRRVSQAAGALTLVLIPLVMHAIPASATGTTNLRLTTATVPSTSIGLSIFANANLLGAGTTPTGTMTFNAFGPADTTCSSPVFTSTVAVTGTSVNSARYTPPHAGNYQWTSTYSGDATYRGAGPTLCGDPASVVTVSRASTYVATTAGPSTATVVHATVVLSNGFAPTGTLSFFLTGPDDMFCSGTPVFTSTIAVNGNGSYDSGPFAPARSGKYTWRASYSGDTDNMATPVTPCLNAAAAETVAAPPPAGDFDGTGRTQLSLFRPNTGLWYIQSTVGGAVNQLLWGQTGDIPVPGDYNADGKTDVAVYRPSTGQWLVKGISDTVYGAPSDIPVPGDYNADGKTDVAVYRPSTGQWLVKGISETVYGAHGDIPVPADYNGDGKTDVGVWRPSNGTWYVKGMFEKVLGQTGDVPQPGDYDGDGRADPTVFRPDPGTWFLAQSTAGAAQSTLGVVGDVVTSLVGVIWSLTGLLGY